MQSKKLSSLILKYLSKALPFLSQALKTSKTGQYQPKHKNIQPKGLERLPVITCSEEEIYKKIHLGEEIDSVALRFYCDLNLSRAVELEKLITERMEETT